MIRVKARGSYDKTSAYLKRLKGGAIYRELDKFGEIGVAALAAATPVDQNITAMSWGYEIVRRPGYYAIKWTNVNTLNGVPVAVMIQYGHATRGGTYVTGIDYVNPAIRPIFDQIDAEVRRVVKQ